MATKILSGWCWQSTIRHFLPPPRLFPVTSRHLAHPQFVLDNHQYRGFLNIWEEVGRRIQPLFPIWTNGDFFTKVSKLFKPSHCRLDKHWKTLNIKNCLSSMSKHFIVFLSRFPGRMCWVWWWPWPYQFYFSADPIDIFYDNSHPSYKTCFKLTDKEECCVYFKPTSVTLSNDKSLLQARQARQDQGRQRCPAGIAQVSSDAFSEFVRSSAAIVKEWAIGHWISQQLSFLCSSSIPIVQPNRQFKNHFNW